jgi:hypothetical protein
MGGKNPPNIPTGTGFTYPYWKTINLQVGDPLVAGDPAAIIAALQDHGWCITRHEVR